MKKIGTIITGTLVLLLAFAKEKVLATPQAKRPNIVSIMADDLDLGTFNMALELKLLPNIQNYMIDHGVNFNESFVTTALCCPSRSTYLSGQYAHNHKVFNNEFNNGSVTSFDDSTALPVWLKNAGYRTGFIGKYLNKYGAFYGLRNDPVKLANAIKHWKQTNPEGEKRLEPTYVPPGWDEWKGSLDPSTYCVYNYTLNQNGKLTSYYKHGRIMQDGVQIAPPIADQKLHNYQTDVYGDLATQFIDENKDRPFYLSVTPVAVHAEICTGIDPAGPQRGPMTDYREFFALTNRPAPRHLSLVPKFEKLAENFLKNKPSFNEADMSDKPKKMRDLLQPLRPQDQANVFHQYALKMAALIAVDDLVGKVVSKLQATGQLDNTFIFFTSDNGWYYGEHRLSEKMHGYEEGIRVPLVIRTPSTFPHENCGKTVINNDIAPTIAELTGATPTREVDGRTIVPLLNQPGSAHQWRKQFLIDYFQSNYDKPATTPADEEGSLAGVPDGEFNADLVAGQPEFYVMSNFYAVRTAKDNLQMPSQTYFEHYTGLQKKDGYYLTQDQTKPTGDWVWNAKPTDLEYYDLKTDPYQLENAAYSNQSSATVNVMQQRLRDLLGCKGEECRKAEDK